MPQSEKGEKRKGLNITQRVKSGSPVVSSMYLISPCGFPLWSCHVTLFRGLHSIWRGQLRVASLCGK